nr:hypothetical protein [Tanacetum cinerariifolium]
MSRTFFNSIVQEVTNHSSFFRGNNDCTGKEGISPLMKCTSAIRQLAYDIVPDFLDEYLQISPKSSRLSLDHFCTSVIKIFGPEYLRKSTMTDVVKRYRHHEEKHEFSEMLGSLDCTDWELFGCPYGYKAQYVRRDHENPFVANGVTYTWRYYLVDGIYPKLVTFVKTILEPSDDDHKRIRYKQMQEAERKDVERAFGVLKKECAILANPARPLKKKRIMNMMYTCIILHNMIPKDKGKTISPNCYPEEAHRPEDLERSDEQVRAVMRHIRSAQAHQNLRADLVEHFHRVLVGNYHLPFISIKGGCGSIATSGIKSQEGDPVWATSNEAACCYFVVFAQGTLCLNDKVAAGGCRQVKVLEFFNCSGLQQGVEDLRELLHKILCLIRCCEGAQGDREAEVFQSGVTKHLGVTEIQQQNGLVDETNVTLFAKGLLAKAKGNILSMEIVGDHSGNTLRVSQSRFYNEKLVHTLLEGHSILLLEGNLSGDCDVEKNGKWSCIYAVGSQEYQMVCTRLDIAFADVGMLDKFNRGLQTDVQVFVDFDYVMGRLITIMESRYELRLVASIATGALVKGGFRYEGGTWTQVTTLLGVAECWYRLI